MSNDPRIPVLNVIETLSDQYLKGKVKAVKLAMMSLLSGGHLLLEDIPGLGKTTLALALAHARNCSFQDYSVKEQSPPVLTLAER